MRNVLLILALVLVAAPAAADVVRLVVDDMIHPISDEYIGRGLAFAASRRADAVLIELRTPGGLMTSMRSIVEKIVRSPVPVIVYVAPSGSYAASAGFVILTAADVAAMAPGTNAGAAHPVLIGEKMDEIMKTKAENDAAAFVRSIARQRGRNVAAAESAVRQSKAFTEREALDLKLIDVIAPDTASLLKAIDSMPVRRFDGRTARVRVAGKPIVPFEMTLKQKVLSWIMDPNVAFLLFALGSLAIWAEFNQPGAILPGVVGLVAILLSVFALNILPTRFAGVALLLAAFVLFALEAKFVSHGILGAGGVVCMIFGALMLVDGPIPEMKVSLATALAVSIPVGLIVVLLTGLVLRSRKERVTTGSEGMIGETGVARTALEPEGTVFVHGEIWNAVAVAPVQPGARIRVSGVDGLKLRVESAD